MADVVIAGSGFAGLTAAIKLKRLLRHSGHRITVVARDATFVYRPSLVLLAFGKKSLKDITFDLRTIYKRTRIHFVEAAITSINPEAQTLMTDQGPIKYDKLIVALGEKLAYDEVPGLREYGYNVCTPDGALALKDALTRYHGGPTVVGWAQNVQTGGPAFEVALELEEWMKDHKVAGSIDFVDPLPKLWAPAGPEATEFLTKVFAERHITRHGPVQIKEVKADRVILSNGEELPSVLTIITPPFRGEDAQKSLAGDNPRDWLETGKDMQSVRYPDIYVAGSAVAFEGPKQGHTAMLQAETAVYNLTQDLLETGKPHKLYDHEMSCVLDLGTGEGLFVRRSLWSQEHQEFKIGRQWPLAKAALAYTFVHTPVFKKWGLSMPK
ncbi:NAD(P)/FAD-dependent oxidoreductase [Sulfobacillus sp. hq2]|uniref:NAD(P)/FAD-dependent oxidoreductase n=1 Tax=Sulfobacillus TaxID=28033 RepID=UPI000CD042A5|nr:FAD-dependent oxidoreductase [Sulfobacillus sp. hq2]POB09968.1 sulfide-quinone oxidoreductase [Sulfobacillus sp. hq2]